MGSLSHTGANRTLAPPIPGVSHFIIHTSTATQLCSHRFHHSEPAETWFLFRFTLAFSTASFWYRGKRHLTIMQTPWTLSNNCRPMLMAYSRNMQIPRLSLTSVGNVANRRPPVLRPQF